MKLEIHNLTKIYPHPTDEDLNFTVLSDLNLTLTDEIPLLLIRGESGVGKTTLLELILGSEKPSAGKIVFDGMTINSLKGREKEKFIAKTGYINQFPQDMVDFRLSPIDNFRLVGAQVDPALLSALEIAQIFDKKLMTYSGGELRRFIVARELSRKPKLLICDEPTAHLDTKNSELVWQMIRDYVENNECLAIVCTHDPDIEYENTLLLEKKGWR